MIWPHPKSLNDCRGVCLQCMDMDRCEWHKQSSEDLEMIGRLTKVASREDILRVTALVGFVAFHADTHDETPHGADDTKETK